MSSFGTDVWKRVDEADIELQIDELRKKLLDELATQRDIINAKTLKASDTHGIAKAKQAELMKMAAALRTRNDYSEGDAFNKEKQAELREARAEKRREGEEKKREQEKKMEEQRIRWEAEKCVSNFVLCTNI